MAFVVRSLRRILSEADAEAWRQDLARRCGLSTSGELVEGTGAAELRGVIAVAREIGWFEGTPIVLIGVELWRDGVCLRLAAETGEKARRAEEVESVVVV